MKTVREYLTDMLVYIDHLESFTSQGLEEIENDIKTELAVRKAYEIIGEIAKRLPDDLLQQQPQVRWKTSKVFEMY